MAAMLRPCPAAHTPAWPFAALTQPLPAALQAAGITSHRPDGQAAGSCWPAASCRQCLAGALAARAARSGATAPTACAAAAATADAEAPAAPPAALNQQPQVVLTREAGKNGPLAAALRARGVACLELPLVETAPGPDRDRLPEVLRAGGFEWVALTSPEAAAVFLAAWRGAGRPRVRLAMVGKGSARIIEAEGEPGLLSIGFTPSQADAVHLSGELPAAASLEQAGGGGGGSGRVLYPASVKAQSTLEDGLRARGFEVQRLNTYNTLPVAALPAEKLAAARAARVVAFASPSAIKAWIQLAGAEAAERVAVACIGATSARAAEKLGLTRIYYPEAPGLDGFAESIMEALQASQGDQRQTP